MDWAQVLAFVFGAGILIALVAWLAAKREGDDLFMRLYAEFKRELERASRSKRPSIATCAKVVILAFFVPTILAVLLVIYASPGGKWGAKESLHFVLAISAWSVVLFGAAGGINIWLLRR